ncbi:MAG: hypothetical protein HYS13_10530 [Planctomycetia bacterium]|nr:hypothetical protein [Planctomycetia bacterium]
MSEAVSSHITLSTDDAYARTMLWKLRMLGLIALAAGFMMIVFPLVVGWGRNEIFFASFSVLAFIGFVLDERHLSGLCGTWTISEDGVRFDGNNGTICHLAWHEIERVRFIYGRWDFAGRGARVRIPMALFEVKTRAAAQAAIQAFLSDTLAPGGQRIRQLSAVLTGAIAIGLLYGLFALRRLFDGAPLGLALGGDALVLCLFFVIGLAWHMFTESDTLGWTQLQR